MASKQVSNAVTGGVNTFALLANNTKPMQMLQNSVTGLGQQVAANKMSDVLADTNIYNYPDRMGQLGGLAALSNQQQAAAAQNAGQQLSFERKNRVAGMSSLLNTGKLHNWGSNAAGTAGAGSVAGASNLGQAGTHYMDDTSGDFGGRASGIVDLQQLYKRNAKNASVQAKNNRPGGTTFQPSVGDLYAPERDAAVNEMMKLYGLEPGQKSTSKSRSAADTLFYNKGAGTQSKPKAPPADAVKKDEGKQVQTKFGNVTIGKVIDGDTMWVTNDQGKSFKVRMADVYAPEIQPNLEGTGVKAGEGISSQAALVDALGGELSMDTPQGNLSQLANGNRQMFAPNGQESYGRQVGDIYNSQGQSVNSQLQQAPVNNMQDSNFRYNNQQGVNDAKQGNYEASQSQAEPKPLTYQQPATERLIGGERTTQQGYDLQRYKDLYNKTGDPRWVNAIRSIDPQWQQNLEEVSSNKWDPMAAASTEKPSTTIGKLKGASSKQHTQASAGMKEEQAQTNAQLEQVQKNMQFLTNQYGPAAQQTPEYQQMQQQSQQLEQSAMDSLVQKDKLDTKFQIEQAKFDKANKNLRVPVTEDVSDKVDNNVLFGVGGIGSNNSISGLINRLDKNVKIRPDKSYAFKLPVGVGQPDLYMTGKSGPEIKESMNFLVNSAASDEADMAQYYRSFMERQQGIASGKYLGKTYRPTEQRRAAQMFNWWRANVKDTSGFSKQDELPTK